MEKYSQCSTRSISSLTELKPGDHIRVPGTKNTSSSFGSTSISSGSTSISSGSTSISSGSTSISSGSTSIPSGSNSASSGSSSADNYQKCDHKLITHHLLVVKAIDNTRVKVIHKVTDGVKEEVLRYRPHHVKVLDYVSHYMGEEAVQRARDIEREGKEYKLLNDNCEHFVTLARTGEKESIQILGAVVVGVGGGTGGVVVGVPAGAVAGALIGTAIGSVVPVVGTLLGGFIGAIVGGIAGVGIGGGGGAAGGAALGTKLANIDDDGKRRKKNNL